MAADPITLGIILDHIQGQRSDLIGQIQSLRSDLTGQIRRLEKRMDGIERRQELHTTILQNIDQRLDAVEIPIIEQKHERRIRRLERHAGLVKA